MKKYYQITKIGNSLFATLPNELVKYLNLKSGDKVSYELIPGKKKVVLNLAPSDYKIETEKLFQQLSKADKNWLAKTAGSLTVR